MFIDGAGDVLVRVENDEALIISMNMSRRRKINRNV